MKPSNAIDQLISQGWSEKRIAKAVGTTQPTINRVKRGSAPTYDLGAALISLALRVGDVPAAPANAPAETV